jgi:hypothetical protein
LHKRSNGVRAWGEDGRGVRMSNVDTPTIALLTQNSFDIKKNRIRETKKRCFT